MVCDDHHMILMQLTMHRTLDVSKVGLKRDKSTEKPLRILTDLTDQTRRLTEGFCDLVLAVFTNDNSTLHDTLGNVLAWDCILLMIERRRFPGIIHAVAGWPQGSRILFLRELASLVLKSWYVPESVQHISVELKQVAGSHYRIATSAHWTTSSQASHVIQIRAHTPPAPRCSPNVVGSFFSRSP